jgi:hypothetical protein
VHQLRYAVAHETGGAETHAYLATVFPLLLLLVASGVVGSFAAAARTGDVAGERVSWRYCTAALLGIFVIQESAEGSPLLSHRGWVVLPIAIVVGRVVSWLLSWLSVFDRQLGHRPSSVPRAPASIGRARRSATLALACNTLAFGLARRPPPFAAA